MGGANGSRECAPDDKLRDTHLFFCEVDGYRFAPPNLRPAISGDKAAAQLAEEELERIVGGYIGETEKNRN